MSQDVMAPRHKTESMASQLLLVYHYGYLERRRLTVFDDSLSFYSIPGAITDPKEFAPMLEGLPRQIPALVETLQGLAVHIFWAERYGLQLSEERKGEVQLRRVWKQLRRIKELDDRPLTCARPLDNRLVGNCRDFSTLLTSMLRYQGLPARARCGFGAYFWPGHYEDHWMVEYWHPEQRRWVQVDSQLDAFQRDALKIGFDPLDMPEGQFVTGGKAWKMCRFEGADPDVFGIFDMKGMEFVRGDLLRDFLSLNKMEILPWDGWEPLFTKAYTELDEQELQFLDNIADLTLAGDAVFPQIRSLYEQDARFQNELA
jgi:hypothetical protein